MGSMIVGTLVTSQQQLQALMDQIDKLGKMPQISMALLGITPGGPLLPMTVAGTPASPIAETIEPAVFEIGLLTLTPGQARTAEQTVVARVQALTSLATQRPYADMFTSVHPAGPADLPVAVLELTFSDEVTPHLWTQLLFQRDLLFVGW